MKSEKREIIFHLIFTELSLPGPPLRLRILEARSRARRGPCCSSSGAGHAARRRCRCSERPTTRSRASAFLQHRRRHLIFQNLPDYLAAIFEIWQNLQNLQHLQNVC